MCDCVQHCRRAVKSQNNNVGILKENGKNAGCDAAFAHWRRFICEIPAVGWAAPQKEPFPFWRCVGGSAVNPKPARLVSTIGTLLVSLVCFFTNARIEGAFKWQVGKIVASESNRGTRCLSHNDNNWRLFSKPLSLLPRFSPWTWTRSSHRKLKSAQSRRNEPRRHGTFSRFNRRSHRVKSGVRKQSHH